ncbi:MAG TPA: thioredoxin family protein [Anaerolineae bacterium]|nr:thioredoxin family protein [Anaerolineae bacterium]
MPQNDVRQIKVGKHFIGIMGLQNTLEDVAKDFAEKPEEEIQAELLKQVAEKNYIPDHIQQEYGRAFLREFNKFLGRPYEEELSEGLEIKILGPGCTRCDMLESKLKKVMTEMNLAANIEHVTDIKEIGKYGVMGTPALLINSEVKCVGSVPSASKLVAWLKEIQEKI